MAAGQVSRFGPYLVQEKLGGGGMAVVYRAVNTETGQTVALKILRASLAEQSGLVDRFMQEATIATRLRHPHIVPVNAYGAIRGRHYLDMQFVVGGTLAQRFSRPVEINHQETIRLLRHIASALDYAHHQGVIHRDLKLENILLNERGDALLTDFGIARIVDGTRLTATGGVMGTPLYISPEQARGLKVDARADLYSFAIIAYVMMVGQFPFDGPSVLAILNQHSIAPVPPPTQINPALPPELDAVLIKGLAKGPADRFTSADTFVETIARVFSDRRPGQTRIDLRSDSAVLRQPIEPAPAESVSQLVERASHSADRAEAIALLKRALELEPLHSKANRLLFQLEGARSFQSESPVPAPVLLHPDASVAPLKKVGRRSRRTGWTYLGLMAFLLSTLSVSYFVLKVIGSPIAGQITGLLTGERPVFDVQGTPVRDIPGIVLTVPPRQVKTLQLGSPLSASLDPGYTDEYVLRAFQGEEIAFGVQFFSPNANAVRKHVAILTPSGELASACDVQSILAGDTGVAFMCPINQTGDWHLRLFGVEGESTGAYVITVMRADGG